MYDGREEIKADAVPDRWIEMDCMIMMGCIISVKIPDRKDWLGKMA